ncbi:MAG TPA: SBBP repeat-containing protein [Terriglobales bacterium]|nr:SBBP repeat-containing protein [Terriglobales bacterium]
MPPSNGFALSRYALHSFLIVGCLFFSVSSAAIDARAATHSAAETTSKAALQYGKIPLAFEPNRGQAAPGVRYVSHARGISIFLRDHETTMVAADSDSGRANPVVIGFSFLGSNLATLPRAVSRQEGISNYLVGDPAQWHTGIPTFAQVEYSNLYPGIDLVYYGNGQYLEQDFRIAAHADYRVIRIHLEGVASLQKDSQDGMLKVHTEQGNFLLSAPTIYQVSGGRRVTIPGGYVVTAKDEVQFRVGQYDKHLPLIIDPVLNYSTYLAGSSSDVPAAIAVDSKGSAYVTGYTFSSDFPVKNPEQAACSNFCGAPDVFVTKLNPAGTGLIYSTFVGGTNADQGSAIAVDSKGNAAVAGLTWSSDFPLKNATTVILSNYSNHGFAFSLTPTGSGLNFSTYLGGTNSDASTGISVDATGKVYVAGYTDSPNFPVTPGHQIGPVPGDNGNGNDIFLAQFSRTGKLAYSTLIGGNSNGYQGTFGISPISVRVDAAQEAILAGAAFAGFPTTPNSFQPDYPSSNGGASGFIAMLNSTGTALVNATYLGGSAYDAVSQIDLDAAGNVYAAGTAQSVDFPITPGAFQTTHTQPGPVSFITKMNPGLSELVYSTYFGGTGSGYGQGISATGIAVDGNGKAVITGYTNQTDLPLFSPLQSQPPQNIYGNATAAFLAVLNGAGSAVEFSTYFSGSTGTTGQGVAVDPTGNPYLTGTTYDSDLPTTPGAFQTVPPVFNSQHAFVTKFDLSSPNAAVCLSTGALYFQSIVGKPSYSDSLTLTNCGSADLLISSEAVSNPAFVVTSHCTKILPGAACTLKVQYVPAAGANYDTGTLQFTDNAPIPHQSIALNGYVDRPTINIYNYGLGFSDQIVGVTSSPVYLQVYTQGDLPLHITSVVATGDFQAVNHCPKSLPPNYKVCNLGATFTPTAVGPATGTLLVYDDAPGSPQVVQLSGNGIDTYPQPVITFSYPNSAPAGSGPVKVNIDGNDIFAESTVQLNGRPFNGPVKHFVGGLEVTLGASLLHSMTTLSLQVVNPAPGGASAPLEFNVFKQTPLGAADVVFEPITRQFYASIPANSSTNPNSLIKIDAVTGAVGPPIPIGSDPGALGLSDDGTTLYVALNGEGTVVPFDISTQTTGTPIALGVDPAKGQLSAIDLQVQPGTPGNVVATLRARYYGNDGIALISNGVVVSEFLNEPPNNVSPGGMRFVGSSDVYGWQTGYNEMGILHFVIFNNQLLEAPGFQASYGVGVFATDGTNLFDINGQIFNASTGGVVGNLGTTGVAIFEEPSVSRLFLSASPFGGFAVFDSNTFSPIGSSGGPTPATVRLGHWGQDGLYYLISNGNNFDLVQVRSNFFNSPSR